MIGIKENNENKNRIFKVRLEIREDEKNNLPV